MRHGCRLGSRLLRPSHSAGTSKCGIQITAAFIWISSPKPQLSTSCLTAHMSPKRCRREIDGWSTTAAKCLRCGAAMLAGRQIASAMRKNEVSRLIMLGEGGSRSLPRRHAGTEVCNGKTLVRLLLSGKRPANRTRAKKNELCTKTRRNWLTELAASFRRNRALHMQA
jgi:hypothetical protein